MKPVAPLAAAIHLALLVNMLSMGSMMMVMPLGPDLVTSLGMAPEQTGYFSGGATQGAALMGLIAAPWLDRVNRKPALLMLLTLRFLLLMACALVQNSQQLLVLFVLSGCVSGPLAAILMAAVLDLVPPAERGRRLAYVSMAFSLAAILVVPLALILAQWFGWQSPFLLFGLCGLLLALFCTMLFPSLPASRAPHGSGLRQLLGSPLCQGALFILCLQMFGHFLLIPHFANYFQFNLAFPRELIATLYMCGGLASMATMRLYGSWIDQGREQGCHFEHQPAAGTDHPARFCPAGRHARLPAVHPVHGPELGPFQYHPRHHGSHSYAPSACRLLGLCALPSLAQAEAPKANETIVNRP